jgi:hypothetical protein
LQSYNKFFNKTNFFDLLSEKVLFLQKNKMNSKTVKIIIEIMWLVMAAFCIGCAVYFHVKGGFAHHKFQIIVCYCLGAISFIMSILRMMQRRNDNKRAKIGKKYFYSE